MNNSSKIIVALDLDSSDLAVVLAKRVAPIFPFFKIGIKLFTQAGPPFVQEILKHGQVFLDLKFHDIPTIVSEAVLQAAHLGVSLITLHASGGSEMMRLSRDRIHHLERRPRLLGVTVLTSTASLREFGIDRSVEEQVVLLAELAREAGMDGIVSSPAEVHDLRERFPRPFLLVTPGIRTDQDEKGDQKRTSSAQAALQAGADYLVIGRPIIAAADPVRAAEKIAEVIS
jgi:orotidine-5'-phosphate decarboxylase